MSKAELHQAILCILEKIECPDILPSVRIHLGQYLKQLVEDYAKAER